MAGSHRSIDVVPTDHLRDTLTVCSSYWTRDPRAAADSEAAHAKCLKKISDSARAGVYVLLPQKAGLVEDRLFIGEFTTKQYKQF